MARLLRVVDSSDPERARQIRRLYRLGMPLDAATEAVDDDRVGLSLLQHLVAGPRPLSVEDVSLRVGLSRDVLDLLDRAAGLRPGRSYGEPDVRYFSKIARMMQVLPEQAVLDEVRAQSPAMRGLTMRSIERGMQLFASGGDAGPDGEEDPVDQAVRIAEVVAPVLDLSVEAFASAYRRLLLQLLTDEMVAQTLSADTDTVDMTVCFIDVVGYTSLSARIDPTGLDEALEAFETACLSAVEAHQDVSLVKFLGDAAMVVSLDPNALVAMVVDLLRQIDDEDGVAEMPVHAGIAHGPTLARAGDYFGTTVNEAARLTDIARRGSVLVTEEVAALLHPSFQVKQLRPVKLQGIGRRRPHVVVWGDD